MFLLIFLDKFYANVWSIYYALSISILLLNEFVEFELSTGFALPSVLNSVIHAMKTYRQLSVQLENFVHEMSNLPHKAKSAFSIR